MRVVITNRTGAHSIWSLMNAIAVPLVADGHEVVFCRFDDGQGVGTPPAPAGVDVVGVEVPPKRRVWDLYSQHRAFEAPFRRLLREFHPDIVHTNFCVPGIGARLIARQERVPAVISTQHELYASMYPHYRWGLRLTEGCADAVVYVSRAVARSFGRPSAACLSERGRDATGERAEPPRHAVIYNGIDVVGLEALAAAAGPAEPGKIICAGRLVPVKGQRVLIEAMPAVLRARPGARLVVIGTGPDEERLRASAVRLRIADRVRFTGWLPRHDDVLREMATAAAVVIPSDGSHEGFGLALAEALALGAPVVASRIPVFEEVAGAAAEGVRFFPPGNRAALAEALTEVLGRPIPGESAAGGRTAPERIGAMFSMERMGADYLHLYRRVLAWRGTAPPGRRGGRAPAARMQPIVGKGGPGWHRR